MHEDIVGKGNMGQQREMGLGIRLTHPSRENNSSLVELIAYETSNTKVYMSIFALFLFLGSERQQVFIYIYLDD